MIVNRITALKFFIVCFLFHLTEGFSQPQHFNWYFGFNGAITFANGAPVAILNSPLNTDEGVASISDTSGQTLFYTNGEVIYNSSNQVMTNGNGLLGSFSTSQSAVIVPFPHQPYMYYIFTQAAQAGEGFPGNSFGGLAYSIVDMSLSNGLGSVTSKNNILTDTTCEALAATSHPSGNEYWVATHKWDSDAFYIYNISCNGLSSTPVISNTGRMHSDTTVGNIGSLGCMKFSPDGTKLGIIWSQFIDDAYSEARLDIFNFNNITGQLTLLDTINFLSGPALQERGYGIEFSPNGRFIYCSTYGLNNGIAFSHLYQLDLSQTDINSTKQIISTKVKAYGSIQRAPDGKIYIARLNGYQHLSALDFPDSLGLASQFVDLAVSLSGNYSTWGLPNNWNQYSTQQPVDLIPLSDTLVCEFTPVTLVANLPYGDFDYNFSWSNGQNGRIITLTDPGTYSLIATNGCDTISDVFVLNNIECNCIVEIPNIVTLNQDGLNDSFQFFIEDCSFSDFSISIFNRWGSSVFESSDSNFEFIPEVNGTYFYISKYNVQNSLNDNPTVNKGVLTVIHN